MCARFPAVLMFMYFSKGKKKAAKLDFPPPSPASRINTTNSERHKPTLHSYIPPHSTSTPYSAVTYSLQARAILLSPPTYRVNLGHSPSWLACTPMSMQTCLGPTGTTTASISPGESWRITRWCARLVRMRLPYPQLARNGSTDI